MRIPLRATLVLCLVVAAPAPTAAADIAPARAGDGESAATHHGTRSEPPASEGYGQVAGTPYPARFCRDAATAVAPRPGVGEAAAAKPLFVPADTRVPLSIAIDEDAAFLRTVVENKRLEFLKLVDDEERRVYLGITGDGVMGVHFQLGEPASSR